jgi:hypothetical protein
MAKPANLRRGVSAKFILGMGVPVLLLLVICNLVSVDAREVSKLNWAALSSTIYDRHIKENTKMTEQDTDGKVKLENPTDAPLIFTEVVLKPYRHEGKTTNKTSVSFNLTVKNQTNRRITRFAFTQKKTKSKSEFYTEQQIVVEPNATQTFLVQIMSKEPRNLTIVMTGAQFDDGTQWGTLHGLPGGKDGLLGTPQSTILKSHHTIMGKIQKNPLLDSTQKDTLLGTTPKASLFGTTQKNSLLGAPEKGTLLGAAQSTLFKAQP